MVYSFLVSFSASFNFVFGMFTMQCNRTIRQFWNSHLEVHLRKMNSKHGIRSIIVLEASSVSYSLFVGCVLSTLLLPLGSKPIFPWHVRGTEYTKVSFQRYLGFQKVREKDHGYDVFCFGLAKSIAIFDRSLNFFASPIIHSYFWLCPCVFPCMFLFCSFVCCVV